MMMPARSMHVAVGLLFRGRRPHVHHLHVELERHARERIISTAIGDEDPSSGKARPLPAVDGDPFKGERTAQFAAMDASNDVGEFLLAQRKDDEVVCPALGDGIFAFRVADRRETDDFWPRKVAENKSLQSMGGHENGIGAGEPRLIERHRKAGRRRFLVER